MTSYIRTPNTFDELQMTTSTTPEGVQTFFGESYDSNRFSLNYVGQNSPGNFILLLYRAIPNSEQELVYTNLGGYLRAERRGDGKTVGITYSVDALAADPNFSAQRGEEPSMPIRYVTPRPQVVPIIEWTGSNFAEIETFCSNWGIAVTDNHDGTITTSGASASGSNLPIGTWLDPHAAQPATAAEIDQRYQDLPSSEGPFVYGVTAES
ncbi:hypothetical protein [Amycolatopsis sp. RTGN1]|uniref:hypothetical protein n=1 Tax=Amycolatopsis ponsaeliensis TaxID=2992142 RepID=UPI0025516C05|nr:hypothetical protein [Amycolatopsis sp. RTGN1]